MTDDELFTLIKTVLAPLGLPVQRAYQEGKTGRPAGAALLMHKISDVRYGWLKREDLQGDPMIHRETQQYHSRFQIGALADPATPEVTASDLCNRAAAALQGDRGLAAMRAAGVGVLRVTDVRDPTFRNDRDQYEDAPSFDLVLAHNQVIITETPAAIVGEFRTARV